MSPSLQQTQNIKRDLQIHKPLLRHRDCICYQTIVIYSFKHMNDFQKNIGVLENEFAPVSNL